VKEKEKKKRKDRTLRPPLVQLFFECFFSFLFFFSVGAESYFFFLDKGTSITKKLPSPGSPNVKLEHHHRKKKPPHKLHLCMCVLAKAGPEILNQEDQVL
jgi:hypothetical protein